MFFKNIPKVFFYLFLVIGLSFSFTQAMQSDSDTETDVENEIPVIRRHNPRFNQIQMSFCEFVNSQNFSFEEFNRVVIRQPLLLLSRDEKGRTPLHLLTINGAGVTIQRILRETFEELKRNKKIPNYNEFISSVLNARDAQMLWTPLHFAAYFACKYCQGLGFYEVIRHLIAHPLTEIHALTGDNKTPIEIAREAFSCHHCSIPEAERNYVWGNYCQAKEVLNMLGKESLNRQWPCMPVPRADRRVYTCPPMPMEEACKILRMLR